MANTFTTKAQSNRKVLVIYSTPMAIGPATTAANYTLTRIDGTAVAVTSATLIGDGSDQYFELALGADLNPGGHQVKLSGAVQTQSAQPVSPDTSVFVWEPHHVTMSQGFQSFTTPSGAVGILPEGSGVFFSPAFGLAVTGSTLKVDQVDVCTYAYDSYEIPSIPDPPVLFSFPAPNSPYVSAIHGVGVTMADPYRLGLADLQLSDLRAETFAAYDDGPCDALLEEPIDITLASFHSDLRWGTYPATGFSNGPIHTIGLAPLTPGPSTPINLQP